MDALNDVATLVQNLRRQLQKWNEGGGNQEENTTKAIQKFTQYANCDSK